MSILHSRFVHPPFSILSQRTGWWQKRKRAWINMGVKAEDLRTTMVDYGAPAYGRKEPIIKLAKTYNNHDQWQKEKKKVQTIHIPYQYNKPVQTFPKKYDMYCERGKTEIEGTGLSMFDPVLCELMYSWFCLKKGIIVDPFAGGSISGIVAAMLGYSFWGCDLNNRQMSVNAKQAQKVCPLAISSKKLLWNVGDCLNLVDTAPDFDLFWSCPPYGNLEVYSNHPADLSNMDYNAFKASYRTIIRRYSQKLRQNRFACFVVANYRDGKYGTYRDFVGDTCRAFADAGLLFHNEIILMQWVGSLPMRITAQFRKGRKVGKVHQNILVFVKGNPEIAAAEIEATKPTR